MNGNIEYMNEEENSQRESLLQNNQDKLFGVYEFVGDTQSILETRLIPNSLTCYANQLKNIKDLDQNPDIHILDLASYMKGEIKVLRSGNTPLNLSAEKLCYMSVGVLEIILGREGKKIHTSVTQRDSGSNDKGVYTNIAGRGIGKNIEQESAREYIEERINIGSDGKFYIPDLKYLGVFREESVNILISAIERFLEQKYQGGNIQTYSTTFEKRFGFKRELLETKLQQFLQEAKDNVVFYEVEDITEDLFQKLEGSDLIKNMKEIKVGDRQSGVFHVTYDERTRAYECRKIILNNAIIQDNFPLGSIFSESSNQRPKNVSLKQVIQDPDNYVPYLVVLLKQMQEVEEEILHILKK